MTYCGQVLTPVQAICEKLASLPQAVASAERLLATIELPREGGSDAGTRGPRSSASEIEFQNVTFAYHHGSAILDGSSFHIRKGDRVAIAGPSGSGKTTLLYLLLRFFEVGRGRILLHGHDLRDFDLDELRAQFAYLPQDGLLIHGTVADNIRYGAPEASDAEMRLAAIRAGLSADFASCPGGNGVALAGGAMQVSGGPRQRIALPRAFVRKAPILLLDEPTSALDAATRSVVLASAWSR